MTGAAFSEIWSSASFAASVAPAFHLYPLYWILGSVAAVAYNVGSYIPLRSRILRQDETQPLSSTPTVGPRLSKLFVVIPALLHTYEEVQQLQHAINSISISPSVQIIVVDDASPTKVFLTLCKVVRHPRRLGPAAARNTGIRLALEYGATSIAFTDSDCSPRPDWAAAHASLQALSPGIWAGKTLASDTDVVSQFYDSVGTLMPRLARGRRQEAVYAPTCNLSVSAEIASTILFDCDFPTSAFEDCDFCVRARNLGHKIYVSAVPVIRHRFKGGVMGLINTYFKYGRSFPIMLEKHPMYNAMLQKSHPMSLLTWKNIKKFKKTNTF